MVSILDLLSEDIMLIFLDIDRIKGMIKKNGFALVANSMGTGKSAILAALPSVSTFQKTAHHKANPGMLPPVYHPTLVICPPSTIVQLYEDIVKFLPNLHVHVYWGGKNFPHKEVKPLGKTKLRNKLRALQWDQERVSVLTHSGSNVSRYCLASIRSN